MLEALLNKLSELLTTEEHTAKLQMKDIIQNKEDIFFTGTYNSQNCFTMMQYIIFIRCQRS